MTPLDRTILDTLIATLRHVSTLGAIITSPWWRRRRLYIAALEEFSGTLEDIAVILEIETRLLGDDE